MTNIVPWSPADGDVLGAAELKAITEAGVNNGVVSGCQVAAASPANKTLVVDAGVICYNGTRITCIGATLDFTSVIDPAYPKVCLVYVNLAGVPQIHAGVGQAIEPAGTSEANWKQWEEPHAALSTCPAGILLAKVKLSAAETDIATTDIYSIAQMVVLPATYNIELCMHNNGQVLPTGTMPGSQVPISGTIISATIISADDTSGSMGLTLKKATYANAPTTMSTIDTYTVTTAKKYQETGLAIPVTAGDWIIPTIDTVTSFRAVTLSLGVMV